MLSSQHYKALVYLNLKGPKFYPLLHQHPFLFSLKFCTTTSDPHSFAVSYLITNLGFSPETALKASKRLRFKTPEKPNSVLTFFRNRGFSHSHICNIIRKEPYLLLWHPHKTILPKFEFFLSKGVSASDIVRMVTANPRILQRSLENHIIPTYKLIHRFLQSDKDTVAWMIRNSIPLSYNLTIPNFNLLIDYGVCDSSIVRLLLTRPSVLCSSDFLNALEEVKGLGFDPSKSTFGVALIAKKAVSKTRWDEKVDVFKKWGWCDETILKAFRRQPNMMLVSSDKINVVMSFWVNELGWDALALAKGPDVIGHSLEKRIIPRASVLQFLMKNGLWKKDASLIRPFNVPEKFFLNKFVECFKEESSHLLKLYQEKLNLAWGEY